MMRLFEFADAEAQVALWKLISDSVWNAIDAERKKQAQAAAQKAVKKPKSSPSRKKAKRAPVTPPAKAKPKAKQKPPEEKKAKGAPAATAPAKTPQVLPKVFTSTARSNPAQPQTPVTSAASLSDQNSLKTRSDRLRAPDSVAGVQRQLDPLASSEVVKRLTQ
jgi:hypothetical protein